MKEHAAELWVREDQLMVGGESAGGGLCAAVCIKTRDTGEVNVAFQMPLYPMLDDRDTETSRDNHGRVWNTWKNHFGWRCYLRGTDRETLPPYAAPARVENMEGLPRRTPSSAPASRSHAETLEYIRRLKDCGIPASVDVYETDMHAFDMMRPKRRAQHRGRAPLQRKLRLRPGALLCSAEVKKSQAARKFVQPVIFQYSPYLSSHAQAASAATEPSDMAVVSWRTDFARQSPDENAGADGQAVPARGGVAALVERDEPAENPGIGRGRWSTKSPDTGRTRRSPPCSTRHRRELSVPADQRAYLRIEHELHIGLCCAAPRRALPRAEAAAPVDEIHLAANFAQQHRVGQRAVAAARDGDILPGEECSVAHAAIAQPLPVSRSSFSRPRVRGFAPVAIMSARQVYSAPDAHTTVFSSPAADTDTTSSSSTSAPWFIACSSSMSPICAR